MLTEERMVRIMDLLQKDSFVSIQDLMKRFSMSRSSIMRDLQELEDQGLIQRVRGGACLTDTKNLLSRYNEPAVKTKEDTQKEAKQLVCQRALQEIREGDCVYIDAGTTPIPILEGLSRMDIELVTTNTYLIQKLPQDFKGRVYLIGGEYSKKYDTSYGAMTTELLRQFHFDLCLMTANGVSVKDNEVYVFDLPIGGIKKEVLKRSTRSLLLIDHTKLQTRAFYTWAKLSNFFAVLIDRYTLSEKCPANFQICEEQ